MFRPASLALAAGIAAGLALAAATSALAQQPEPKPLTAMPYSPSLDVTSMDRTVDPCTDFYKYSCGGWMKNNPIPADQASWSVYGKLTNENQQFLWGILEQDAKLAQRNTVQQKIGDYYAACMDTSAIDAAGIKPIEAALKRIDKLSTREAILTALPYLEHELMGTFFFNSGVEQDAENSDVMMVGIGAGGLGLPDRDYYLKTDDKSVALRTKYVALLVKLLVDSGESEAQAKADADATMRIETALAKSQLTRVERRDPHKIFHRTSMADLQKMAPAIDWPVYFRVQGPKSVTTLNVSQPAFVKEINAELKDEPVDALRGYLRAHVMLGAAPSLAQPIAQAHFDFFSTTLRGTPSMPPRWKTCVRAVDRNLGEALGQEFVARTFTPQMKADTDRMTQQIEAAMKQEIEGLDWMTPETKKQALEKLHEVRNKIGYPTTWRDYTALDVEKTGYFGNALRASRFEEAREWNKLGKPVDRNEWGMTPPTVNAYYDPSMNDINFPAGVLQPPLYDPKEDAAPNYGNTGSTIGHELTHAFDDEGRQFDGKGNLRDWWTPADAKGFEDRINCIRDQYAGYVVVDDIHIQSKLTSGEDVADLGGTLLGYMAWKVQTATENLEDKDGLTPDQRYFVGMAQWACENERPENQRANALTDPHSPGWARVNGVVVNMPEFQKAFGCKVGQPMVHVPACKVW
ncbi:endothelin-converting enzyme Metallo peptidase. MEROPS family M13 [Bryocella elongata]|uniref:Endothelin-converting enzyme Metallo peptidase. MEROPS family M13 n=1 Tax=Bryocella elongata TaxID=863522 RepID=A0A1H6A4C6_9BACT|nr:M13 family metallopeptidase [Bryocella elongata]SEG43578.1 endothelin-converting enzyme Metallo peptidase. MEROPS family M13 [Bryocella elongata]